MSKRRLNEGNVAVGLASLAIIATIAAQIDMIASVARLFMFAFWILTFLFLIVCNKWTLPVSPFCKVYFVGYALYILHCALGTLQGGDHFSSRYLSIMRSPLLVTFVASLLRDRVPYKSIIQLFKVYIISSLLFAIYCNLTFFSSYQEWLLRDYYGFSQKNSAAQIWFVAVFLIFFVVAPDEKKISLKIGWYVCALYLIFMGGLSQCRTAILGIACVVVYQVIRHSKHKLKWALFFASLSIALWIIPVTNRYLSQVLLLQKYINTSLDVLSSGRVVLWRQAIEVFSEHILFGVGEYYVDMSYLLVLAESGIIGFLLIEAIWIARIAQNIKCVRLSKNFRLRIFDSFIIFYLVESLLEGYPPFGPGASSFMFWFVSELGMRIENSDTNSEPY